LYQIVEKECLGNIGVRKYMSIAFVLINAEPTLEHEVYMNLKSDPIIIELHPLFGEYDLIAKIQAESFEKLGEIVTRNIRLIKGVIDTKTLTGTKS
jgi:DNA-binding Lrp family transcriptional regulator